MDSNAQAQDRVEPVVPVPQAPPDHYSALMNAIAKASSDLARLRELIYAMALHDLKPGAAARDPIPDPVEQAKTLVELEQALQFEHAIFRIERHAAEFNRTSDNHATEGRRTRLVRPPRRHRRIIPWFCRRNITR